MRWPSVPSSFYRLFFGAFLMFWLIVTYGIPNKYIFFTPTEVPLTFIDHLIPLQIWTIWIYVGTYFSVALVFLTARENDANEMFYTLAFAAGASFFLFTFLPTSIDRNLYPIPAEEFGWSVRMLQHIRHVDVSVNCAPSMHVVMGWALMIGVRSWSKPVQLTAVLWGLAIIYSTMSTKQHYFLDAVSGTALAYVSFLTARKIQPKPIEVREWLSRLAS